MCVLKLCISVLQASDSENEAITNITIQVEDVNDNVPQVPQQTYEVCYMC